MFNWLRNIIRKWLQVEPKAEDSNYLDCMISTKHGPAKATFCIVGAMGLKLQAQMIVPPAGTQLQSNLFLLSDWQALDVKRWWELWERHNTLNLTWDDGTPFDPKAQSQKLQ